MVFRGERAERKEIRAKKTNRFPRSDASKLRSFSSTPLSLPAQRFFKRLQMKLRAGVSGAAALVVTGSASQLSAAVCHPPAPPAGFLSTLRSCSALFQLLSLRSPPDVSRCTPNAARLHLQIHCTGKRHLYVLVCMRLGVCVC